MLGPFIQKTSGPPDEDCLNGASWILPWMWGFAAWNSWMIFSIADCWLASQMPCDKVTGPLPDPHHHRRHRCRTLRSQPSSRLQIVTTTDLRTNASSRSDLPTSLLG